MFSFINSRVIILWRSNEPNVGDWWVSGGISCFKSKYQWCVTVSFVLQLIHSSVVDTAIVFPHRLGLPYKRALKNLMADHLKRIIQDNGERTRLWCRFTVVMSNWICS